MNRWLRYTLLVLMLGAVVWGISYLNGLKTPVTTSQNTSGQLEFVNPSGFINTDPFALSDVIGKKVILVDFWTYSCINCERTLPYLNAWWQKYQDKGLLIVGVHTPEFEFEKDKDNVAAAVKKFGVEYPVVMDNDRSTWDAFGNRYWPHEYLIDLSGKVVYDHIGEGNYDETESELQKTLGLDDMGMSTPTDAISIDFNKVNSPETYFGSDRAENARIVSSEPTSLEPNQGYMVGDWTQENEYAVSGASSSLLFEYNAKNVYMVGSADSPTDVEVWIDGKLSKTVTVNENTLYTLVEGNDYGTHTLKIVPKGVGLKLFTFTFG